MSEKSAPFKAAAQRYAEYYADVRRALTSEYSSNVRWLTASLFALNAGGLIALSNKSLICLNHKIAGVAFWLGIVFAFSFVVYAQTKLNSFLRTIQQIEERWVLAASTGKIDENRMEELEKQKTGSTSKWSNWLSGASFALFSTALFILAFFT